jgi:D-3-phosphoglycerate dehydrogenase
LTKKRIFINLKFWPENMGPLAAKVSKAIDSLQEIADVELSSPKNEDELIQKIPDVDAAIPQLKAKWTPFLQAANKLRMIQAPAQGRVFLNVNACTEYGVICCNVQNAGAESVAQHAIALMLTVSKHIAQDDRAMRRGILQRSVGSELNGKTLGIIGLGGVGGRIALKSRVAFNMRVLAYDPYLPWGTEKLYGAELVDLDTLLHEADVIVVCALLTAETHHLLSDKQFEMMKHTVILVNMAGAIVDEHALIKTIRKQAIGGVGIDVLEEDPLPSTFVTQPTLMMLHAVNDVDVVITPHSSRQTIEATIQSRVAAVNNIMRYVKGKKPYWILNPIVLSSR